MTVVGRNRGRLDRAVDLGAEAVVEGPSVADLGAHLKGLSGHGQGPDVVIEAVGLPETCEAAVRAVR